MKSENSRRNQKLYHIYHGIKQRCYNPNNPRYKNYGERGIEMCREWFESYKLFSDWALQSGYKDGLSIDRVDNDGNYCPENCRWISLSENASRGNQGKHKNHSKLEDMKAVSPSGKVVFITNISDFSRTYGLNRPNVSAALHGRISNELDGWKFYSNKIKSQLKA